MGMGILRVRLRRNSEGATALGFWWEERVVRDRMDSRVSWRWEV